MTPLCKLALKFDTDKGIDGHGYTQAYYQLLKDRTDSFKLVLEVGILGGGSLRMWKWFFPNAMIVGIDKEKDRMVNEDRIRSFRGNQLKSEKLARIVRGEFGEQQRFDMIVDDGTHLPESQISTFNVLFPYLRHDGIYFIEDIDIDNITSVREKAVPPWLQSMLYRSKWRHRRQHMLIIWDPNNVTPDFNGLERA